MRKRSAMALGLAMAMATSSAWAAGPAAQCPMVALVATLDDGSFTDAGWKIDAARSKTLTDASLARLGTAFAKLCGAKIVRPDLLKPFARLLVQNGEGATDPVLYADEAKPDTLIFQYAFQDGPPPEADAFDAALLCLGDPNGKLCGQD